MTPPLLFTGAADAALSIAAGEVIGLTQDQFAARREMVEVIDSRPSLIVARARVAMTMKVGDAIKLLRPASIVAKAAADAAKAEAAIRAQARGKPEGRRVGIIDAGLDAKGRR